jgi:eukaryotic-like serine/threonine-protein kinase
VAYYDARMSLAPGARLGPYAVISKLGEGGMGEVYRAADTRLKRDVAIKVLPVSVAGDAERLARFQREAEMLAALNHPHIAHIYGVEESDGTKALVMELVEGPTLADRIARGPIPLDEALPIATQIAEALDAAHDRGIVHRDLKPANIKVRDDGTVKVLDFGLAKATDQGRTGSSPRDVSASPTITSPAHLRQGYGEAGTEVGMILGTAAYMSPEQARGQAVDARADLWALGCVLFEMLAGTRAFAGETVTDVLAAVVKEEPRWQALPADTPAAIRWLLRRCFCKDRRRRLASAADARLEIEEPRDTAHDDPAANARTTRGRSPVMPALGVAVAIAAVAGAYVLGGRGASDPPAPVTRFVIPAPPGTQIVTGHRELALSNDGRQVAFIARGAADQHIYVRRIDELTARQVAGTDGARDLVFSPDGRWLAFHAGDKIRKVSLDGGVPVALADAVHSHGLAWHPAEDVIYFAPHQLSAIWKVPANGESPAVQVTTLDTARGERSHEWPIFSRDGGTVIFSVNANAAELDEEAVSIITLATNVRHTMRTGGSAFALTDLADLKFVRRGSLMSARYKDGRLASPDVLDSAAVDARVALSPTGTLAYVPAPDYKRRSLVWISPDGRMSDAGFGQRSFGSVTLSPDGRRVAIALGDDRDDGLYAADAGGGALTLLARPAAWIPVWSPDGKRIAATVRQSASGSLAFSRVATEAGRNWEVLVDGIIQDDIVAQWTPDSRGLLFSHRDLTTGRRSVMLLALDSTPPKASTIVDSGGNHIVQSPSLSPDGRWLAYESNESGRLEVYVQSYPAATGRVQVSREGGSWPLWSKGGDTIYFRAGPAVMSSTITTQPELRSAVPRVIVSDPLLVRLVAGARPFDIAPDGRILAIKEDGSIRSDHIVVVQNWLGEGRSRQTAGRE